MRTRLVGVGALVVTAGCGLVALPASAQDGKRPKSGAAQRTPAESSAQRIARQRAAAKKAEAVRKQREAEQAAREAAAAEEEAVEAEAQAAEEPLEEAPVAAEEPGEAADESPDDVVADVEPAESPDLRRDKRRHSPRSRRSAPRERSWRAPRAEHAPPPQRGTPSSYAYAGPYTMEYIEGAEVPPGYTKVERVRRGLVVGGAVTWGVSWLIAATAALSIDDNLRDDTAPLFVPVVGPFIAMGTLDPDGAGRAALFVNGVAQVAGLGMFIGGLAATNTVLVRTGDTQINMRPGVGSLSFDGTF